MNSEAPKGLKLVVQTVVTALASSSALVDPAVGVAAATAAPTAMAGLEEALAYVQRRRQLRQGLVLDAAARREDLTAGQLIAAMSADAESEELLLRTLSAAGDAALADKLIALAIALAEGVGAGPEEKQWEIDFVRALADLGSHHVQLLRKFTQSATELGLAHAAQAPDPPVLQLNEGQLGRVAGLPNLSPMLGTLQRHGLLAPVSHGGGMSLSVGAAPTTWRITPFGQDFLDRLNSIGAAARQVTASN